MQVEGATLKRGVGGAAQQAASRNAQLQAQKSQLDAQVEHRGRKSPRHVALCSADRGSSRRNGQAEQAA